MQAASMMENERAATPTDAQLARLKLALRVVGIGWTVFFLAILANELAATPLWDRHGVIGSLVAWGHGGREYLLMLCAINIPLGAFLALSARDPQNNRMFIDFAVITNAVHLTSMLVMAVVQPEQHTNLMGDVPAGLLPTLLLGALWWPVRAHKERA